VNKRFPLTMAELRTGCPLVEIESTTQGLVGKKDGVVVLRVRGDVNAGSIRKFLETYNRMEEAGLFIPRTKENDGHQQSN
jgi:hypothetical protein